MSHKHLHAAIATGCVLAVCQIAGGALAQSSVNEIVVHPPAGINAETRHKTVSYADLNLTTQSGDETILSRIKAAAKEVCAPKPAGMPSSLKDRSAYQTCYDGAVSAAVSDVGNDGVSAMYAKNK
jgi:UrcA family protein